jgi:hypothetical protein
MLRSYYEKMEQMREDGRFVRMMIIFDDLAFMKGKVNNDETVTKILYNGRHPRILFLWAQQYVLNAGPDLRSQNRLTFSTFDKTPKNQYRLFEAFNPCFEESAAGFRDFRKIYRSCTENRGLMVLDNQYNESTEIGDNVYFYRPEFPVPPFKMMKHTDAWKYDKMKQKQEQSYVKAAAPVSGAQGLTVNKRQKKKRKRHDSDSDDSDEDDTPKKKRQSALKTNKSTTKPWPEYVTIQ